MTKNGNLKRRVRARAAKTGESYTSALMHIRRDRSRQSDSLEKSVRLAVARTTLRDDPRDGDALHAGGSEIRCLMREAHAAGAKLVHFPEGALCAPNKRILSCIGPDEIGSSDWSKVPWGIVRNELNAVRMLARELRLWTVFGSAHELTPPQRPHNSLYVLSDQGELVTRYDERMLSNTKISLMYTPGSKPVTFDVEGIRFGCALGMEAHYPELFSDYERLDVQCVLFSTTNSTPAFAAEMQGHAASNTYWMSYAAHADDGSLPPSGLVSPDGEWTARCGEGGSSSLAVSDIHNNPDNLARPWRRKARSGIYAPHQVRGDPRSDRRDIF